MRVQRIEWPALTRENLYVTFTEASTSPTSYSVHIAVVSQGATLLDSDFVAGSWEAGGPPYRAKVMTGPLTIGAWYDVYYWVNRGGVGEQPKDQVAELYAA